MADADRIDVATARERALVALCNTQGPQQPLSAIGYAVWPNRRFFSPQGAALAASRIVASLVRDGLACRVSFGYQATSSGRRAVLDGTINAPQHQ